MEFSLRLALSYVVSGLWNSRVLDCWVSMIILISLGRNCAS